MIKLIDILKEGAYDSMTRNIVTDVMREWKDQYMDEQGDLEFENDYELTDAKGRPFEFELNAILRVKATKSQNKNPLINTPKGVGQIENLYVSELGFLMVRVYFDNGTYTTYNMGKHDIQNNLITNQLFEDESKTFD